MQNKAKCKLCNSLIESFHSTDYVECKCGQISVSGGSSMECGAIDWKNFVRIDDKGNEIVPIVKDVKPLYMEESKPLSKDEVIGYVEGMLKSYENMPKQAMDAYVTHRDQESILTLLLAVIKSL